MPLEPLTLAPPQNYTFTVPRPRKRHPPAPGCSLCTILTTLEDAQRIPLSEEASQHAHREDPPFSPALPSPAVVGNPLLPSTSQPATAVGGRVLLLDDDELTAWVASPAEELAREGRHVVIAFKRHIEDVYAFGPPDIPLLVHALQTAHTLLDRAPSSTKGKAKATDQDAEAARAGTRERRIGLLTGLTRDPQFPYAHLHIHALLPPADAGSFYRRHIIHGAWNPGWWGLEDLIAEIRESTSNNRVKSGYGPRAVAAVPEAGTREGLPNALEPPTSTDAPHSTQTDHAASRGTPSASPNDTAGNIPPALLDAVIRDAERTFGAGRVSENKGVKGKGKQRQVEPAPEGESAGAGAGGSGES